MRRSSESPSAARSVVPEPRLRERQALEQKSVLSARRRLRAEDGFMGGMIVSPQPYNVLLKPSISQHLRGCTDASRSESVSSVRNDDAITVSTSALRSGTKLNQCLAKPDAGIDALLEGSSRHGFADAALAGTGLLIADVEKESSAASGFIFPIPSENVFFPLRVPVTEIGVPKDGKNHGLHH